MTDPTADPLSTAACIDYGHHGRERCVFCGLERSQEAPSD